MPFKTVFIVTKKEFQPQLLKYPNRRGANWSFQVSACLSSWTWTTVESQHFGVCLRWVLTIKYNWWQYDTIQNQKRKKIFLATMRAIHRMGKTWRGVFSDNSSKKRRWATVYILSTGVHFRSLRRPSSTLQTIPLSLFEVLRWSLEIHILGLDSGGKKVHFRIYRRHIRWTIFTVCARWTFGNLRGEAPHSILGNLVQFCPYFLGEITIIWTGRQRRTTDIDGFWGKTHFGRRCQ